MAKRQLQFPDKLLGIFCGFLALQGCSAGNLASNHMTLIYKCEGSKIVVWKFEPEAGRSSSPGVVNCGPKGGATMAFLSTGAKFPRYADVEWWVHPHIEMRFRKRIDLADLAAKRLAMTHVEDGLPFEIVMRFKNDQLEVELGGRKGAH